MKRMSRLFYFPLGESEIISPKPNETVDALHKRLLRLARSYRTWGRAFRVEKRVEGVLWWRVEPGQQTKLAWWYRLSVGGSIVMKHDAGPADLASAKATARHLRRKGAGIFAAALDGADLIISRLPNEPPRSDA
jgi:hypothetical protein